MPREIGPYRLLARLMPGGMGHVWLAVDTRDGMQVAVKEPALEACEGPSERARSLRRFDREARVLQRLDHPNVVRVREALVLDGRPYLVMEYVDGETLDRTLRRQRLSVPAVAGVVRQLLEAAGHAHERGVVHRDIKPGNIFLLPGGDVKLADFGIADLAEDGTTTTTTLIATVPYMSPEQARGDPVDGRADLFTIGIIAYEALTGVHPFRRPGDQPVTTVFRIVHEEPAPALREGLSPGLSELLGRALQKDPPRRFGSAAEMRAALAREAPSLEAQHAELVALARTAPRPKLEGAGDETASVLPDALTLAIRRPPPPPPPATHAPQPPALPAAQPPGPPPPRRRRRWPWAVAAVVALLLAAGAAGYSYLSKKPYLQRVDSLAATPLAAPVAPAYTPPVRTPEPLVPKSTNEVTSEPFPDETPGGAYDESSTQDQDAHASDEQAPSDGQGSQDSPPSGDASSTEPGTSPDSP